MHAFNPEIAAKTSILAAVIYQNILYWCEKNYRNGKHRHDGKTWTYNSNKAFLEQFYYATAKQIRTALDALVDAGLISKGNYNENRYDRTLWYSVTVSEKWAENNDGYSDTGRNFDGKSSCPNDKIELPYTANGDSQKGESIYRTNINTNINTDNIPPLSPQGGNHKTENQFFDFENEGRVGEEESQPPAKQKKPTVKKKLAVKPHDVDAGVWDDFLELRRAKRAPLTQTALQGIRREAEKLGWKLEQALVECCESNWQGFKAEFIINREKNNGKNRQFNKNTHATIDQYGNSVYSNGASAGYRASGNSQQNAINDIRARYNLPPL
jgi:hypothetical protein